MSSLLSLHAYESGSESEGEDGVPGTVETALQTPLSLEKPTLFEHEMIVDVSNEDTPLEKQLSPKGIKYTNLDKLPLPVSAEVNGETVMKIKDYLDAKIHDGYDLTQTIRSKKDFGNPYILTTIVDSLKIDEIGSNYPTHIFDPHGYQEVFFVIR